MHQTSVLYFLNLLGSQGLLLAETEEHFGGLDVATSIGYCDVQVESARFLVASDLGQSITEE